MSESPGLIPPIVGLDEEPEEIHLERQTIGESRAQKDAPASPP